MISTSIFRYDDSLHRPEDGTMSSPQKRVGVVLAGCGFLDGAEIHEATLTLLFLDRRSAKVTVMAPDVEQMHVMNHVKGEPAAGERRSSSRPASRAGRS